MNLLTAIGKFFVPLHRREIGHLAMGFLIGFIPIPLVTIVGVLFVLYRELRYDPFRWCNAKWLWRIDPLNDYGWMSAKWGQRYLPMDVKGWLDLSVWMNGILFGILVQLLVW